MPAVSSAAPAPAPAASASAASASPVASSLAARPAHPLGAVRAARPGLSVLAWPAWLRVLAVLPAVALLWLAVAWAAREAAPW